MAVLSAARRRTAGGRPKVFAAASIVLAALLLGGLRAESQAPSEYQVKAVFLYHFAQFVTWPEDARRQAQAPLIIGVLGEDPFGSDLDEVVRGEAVNGRPLAVRRFASVEQVDICHILFISDTERQQLDGILAALADRSILTVGDGEDFSRRGVMINFVTDRNRIRLRINLGAAEAAGLTLSSKLLRPAEIVGMAGD